MMYRWHTARTDRQHHHHNYHYHQRDGLDGLTRLYTRFSKLTETKLLTPVRARLSDDRVKLEKRTNENYYTRKLTVIDREYQYSCESRYLFIYQKVSEVLFIVVSYAVFTYN